MLYIDVTQYGLYESDTNDTINQQIKVKDLQQLSSTVEGMQSNNISDSNKFSKLVRQKYGVNSVHDIKKIPTWMKVGKVSLLSAGLFKIVMDTIRSGTKFVTTIFGGGSISSTIGTATGHFFVGVVCALISFIVYKALRQAIRQPTTESYDYRLYNAQYKHMVIETELFTRKVNRFLESIYYESDVTQAFTVNSILQRAKQVCNKMFDWIKAKFRAGAKWVKEHPYLTLAILVIVGFVFYSILNRGASPAAASTNSKVNGATSKMGSAKKTATTVKSMWDLSDAELTKKFMRMSQSERLKYYNILMEKNPDRSLRIYDMADKMLKRQGKDIGLTKFFG